MPIRGAACPTGWQSADGKPALGAAVPALSASSNPALPGHRTEGGAVPMDLRAEWLEPDGLGGFASGTVSGERTRRYHALLLTATTPPTGRVVLVNGMEAWLEDASGRVFLSTQRYTPDVQYPEGWRGITGFSRVLWPRWHFDCGIRQDILAGRDGEGTILRWRRRGDGPDRLFVRPLLSGR